MFALPQATTSAVRPARDGDRSASENIPDRRSSFFGSSSRPSAASNGDMPSTPSTRPSGDTDVGSTLVGSSSDDSSMRDRGRSLFSPQVSTANSPSLARRQGEEGVKKKKSFIAGFSLRSRKSSSALSRTASTETWQTTASDDQTTSANFGPAISTPNSSVGFFNRKRAKSSPRTPDEHVYHSPKSISSFMSTDSVTTIATVSPLGRSPHLPTPLRYSSTADASEDHPALDLDEPFPGILPYNSPIQTPRLAPRQEGGNRSFSSPITPNIPTAPSNPQSARSQWFDDRNGYRIPYVVSKQPGIDQTRSPDPEGARSNDNLALEWSQYCEMVKHELRRQEKKEARDPLGVPPQDGTSKEMDDYATKKRGRTEDKIKIAAKFIHRTSTCGLMLREGWQESFPQELSVYQTLAEWEKHHTKRDPQMKETVLKRLFKKVKQELSSPALSDPERTPTVPALSRRRGEDKFLVDDASDTPLASSPDEEHYQVHGLGISSFQTSFDSASAEMHTTATSLQENDQGDFTPTVPAKSPLRHTSDSYFTSPTAPFTSPLVGLMREDKSGWETIADDDIDIDDDLIAAANAAGSTPDLRQKFRDEQCEEDLLRSPVPPVPQISPEIRQKYENAALPMRPSVPRHSSVLLVRRDSSRDKFSPKLNSEEGQAEFDRGVQAAAQRRIDKMSKVPLATNHPALRVNTSLSINPRSSSLPLHVPKTRVSEPPTPTKAKPAKPAKPPGLATHLALRKLQEDESPPAAMSYIPRPPKYGQRISPGKTLDSPKANDGPGNVETAVPLPSPNRYVLSTGTPRSGRASTIVEPDEDDDQDTGFPADQMDTVVAAWRGPRTPSMPPIHDYENSPSMQEAQRMRQRLGLPLLEHKRESDPPHPNHKYAWNTTNLMCMGIHRGAYEPVDSGPSQENLYEASPLRGFDSGSPSSAIRLASYNTFNSISFNYEGKSCHACQRTCCYYAEQLAIMNMGFVQNPSVRAAVERARRHENDLRREFPSGVERYDAHMKCSDCGVVSCFEHGMVCKTLSCRAALCDGCADAMGGRCSSHRDKEERQMRQIEEVGLRMDRAVEHFQSLRDLDDEVAAGELIDGLL